VVLFERLKDSMRHDFESPGEAIVFFLIGAASQYGLYWAITYCLNAHTIVSEAYSLGGKVIATILSFVALFVGFAGLWIFPFFWWRVIRHSYMFVVSVPTLIANEFDIIKRIWHSRGFAKYRLFGGFAFYFKLRQRVFAYALAFVSIGIVAWYFVFMQHSYEKTYWKINFYYNEPLPAFTFKPHIPYTVKSKTDFYGVIVNSNRYVTGSSGIFAGDEIHVIPLSLPSCWNVTFTDTTTIEFMFYEDYISSVFSMTLEVWENKAEGHHVRPESFSYRQPRNLPATTNEEDKNGGKKQKNKNKK